MNKISLLTIMALLSSSFAFAQTKTDKAQVKWGADMDMKADGTFEYVIGDVDNSTYMILGRHNKPFIQRMDGLTVAYQKPLDLMIDKDNLKLERVVLTKSEVAVFSSRFDKNEKLFQLYVSTYDQDGFSPKKRFDKVARIEAEKSKNKGGFSIYSSPDHSKVMVQIEEPYDKEANEKFALQVYDASMDQLWAQEVQLPYSDAEFGTDSYRVDNDGSVIMLGVKYAEKQESKQLRQDGKPNYEYHLLTFAHDSPVAEDHPIEVPDKFLQDLTLSMGETGDIILPGFMGTKGPSMCGVPSSYDLTGPPSR